MTYSFRHTDPMLAGTLVKEKVKCGRKNCRCARGKKLHGWYYYLYWRDYPNGGTLKKDYVPRADVKILENAIKAAKKKDNEEKSVLQICRQLFKQLPTL
jgi:hypothetical protein